MKKIITGLVFLVATQAAFPIDALDKAKGYVQKVVSPPADAVKSVGFASAFPKPFYKTTYFGPVLTGVTIIGAGAFSYLTAGAGAPIAATGVSSVAAWVGGGGAGSYMAGLSTIGGWFGGNAMLGSAVLNGISIGITGGGAAFSALPAVAKVGVMASVTATALDGVAVFQRPETQNLSYRIRLTVPRELGGKDVRLLSKQLYEVEEDLLKEIASKDGKTYIGLLQRKNALLQAGVKKGNTALKGGVNNEDLVVLAIVSKNAGQSELFTKLLGKVVVEKMKDTGYIDYLKAVDQIERGGTQKATDLLKRSWHMNPYALEQPLLLINILGAEGFVAKEGEIRAIVEQAKKDFSNNKYESSYSLVSLYYRLASMYLLGKKYGLAQTYFESALSELSFLQMHLGNKSMKSMIRLGIANAMYHQNKEAEAIKLVGEILMETNNDAESSFIRSQFVGYM